MDLWEEFGGFIAASLLLLDPQAEFKLKDFFQLEQENGQNVWIAHFDNADHQVRGSDRQRLGKAFRRALANGDTGFTLGDIQPLGVGVNGDNVGRYRRV